MSSEPKKRPSRAKTAEPAAPPARGAKAPKPRGKRAEREPEPGLLSPEPATPAELLALDVGAHAPARHAPARAPAPPEPRAPPADRGRARDAGGLPQDVARPGYSWCGVCATSLAPARAAAHLETLKHQDNAERALRAAIHARSGPRQN